jgi:hypothetical protein
MGRACSMHWREKKCVQGFIFVEKPGEKPLTNPGDCGRITL